MGPKSTKTPNISLNTSQNPKDEKLTRFSFDFIEIIGKGGFGKVWKVYSQKYKSFFAMKEMLKTKIIDKKSIKNIKNERNILSSMHHPFIININFSFQDKDTLFIGMDYLNGGDLRYHINKNKKFTEKQTKFFIGCIILSLEYIHKNNIIHRDLKPENLVLDSKGYVKLTDFGIAKKYDKNNLKDSSGTPGYMAPEVLCRQNHNFTVDFFALGIIGYEFMNGIRPYLGKNRKEIKEKIMAKQAQVKKSQIPKDWSLESADFINRCLQRKPSFRLGLRGISEIKEHSWFKYFPWKDLYLKKIESNFIPNSNENIDYQYCNAVQKIGVKTQERYLKIINSDIYKNAFCDFKYFNRFSICENDYETMEKIVNPHEIYEIENKNIDNENNCIRNNNISQDLNIKNKILNLDNHNNMNKTFIKIMGDERYSSLKKIPYSHYTSLYLKNNKKSANNSLNSGNSSIVNNSNISNSGILSNTRHSNEIVKEFY